MKDLAQYAELPFEMLTVELPKFGYGVTHRAATPLRDVRKAIGHGQPVFTKLGDRVVLLVGTELNGFVIQSGDEHRTIPEAALKKAWTGDTVTVTEKTDPQVTELPVPDGNVIFVDARDTWPADQNDKRDMARQVFNLIDLLPECYRPAHPVIVIFKVPGPEENKDHVRSMTIGAEITIFDPADPVSEFFHELGHVFYRTRLTDAEKTQFTELQKALDPKHLPGILTDTWCWRDGEELFCTVYMWYLKGKLIHVGYQKILDNQYPKGCATLCAIFHRIETGKVVQKAWVESERRIAAWLTQIEGKPNVIALPNGRMIKAKLPKPVEMLPLQIPVDLPAHVLYQEGNCRWIQPTAGILKGRIMVARGDRIDPVLTKARGSHHYLSERFSALRESAVQSRYRDIVARFGEFGGKFLKADAVLLTDTEVLAKSEKLGLPVLHGLKRRYERAVDGMGRTSSEWPVFDIMMKATVRIRHRDMMRAWDQVLEQYRALPIT